MTDFDFTDDDPSVQVVDDSPPQTVAVRPLSIAFTVVVQPPVTVETVREALIDAIADGSFPFRFTLVGDPEG